MKITDAPSTSRSITINASSSAVFALVTDLNTPAQSSSEFSGADWIDADGPAVGASFVGRNAHPAIGKWETTAVVSEYVPDRVFAYTISAPQQPPGAVWRYELRGEDGAIELTQSAQIGPGPSGISAAIEAMPEKEEKILRRRLSEHEVNIEANLATIKRLAEAESAG